VDSLAGLAVALHANEPSSTAIISRAISLASESHDLLTQKQALQSEIAQLQRQLGEVDGEIAAFSECVVQCGRVSALSSPTLPCSRCCCCNRWSMPEP
jgi:hypothetical protein